MTIGKFFRKVFGPKYFPYIGKAYRRIFVDVQKIVADLPEMSPTGHLLDIGGGDGELINHIKKRFPRIKISMIDTADSIGNFIEEEFKKDISFFPSTSIKEFKQKHLTKYSKIDYILISDVVHHIIPQDRAQFFLELSELIDENNLIIFKDVCPGYFSSKLAYWADRYITGDKNVELINQQEIKKFMMDNFPKIHMYETNLFKRNKPNYLLVFSLKDQPLLKKN